MKRELPPKIPLYEQIYTHILNEVRTGRLKSGDRVPSEHDLGGQFNVSRITSKKALEMLEQVGVIERTRGKGSFVRHNLPDLNSLNNTDSAHVKVANGHDLPSKGAIGVIFADIGDSYGMSMLYVIQEYSSKLGFHIILRLSRENQETEEATIRAMLKFGVQGLMIMPVHGEYYNSELVQLVFRGFPVVLVDRYLSGIPARAICTDNRRAAQELTEHLLKRGHSNIAFISASAQNTSSIVERIQGYSTALASYVISIKPEYILTTLSSTRPQNFQHEIIEADASLLTTFILDHPEITAFFACEYSIAVLLLHVLQQLGKNVPEDCAIVCFDTPQNQFMDFTFTHIQQNELVIGRTAVDMLVDQINKSPLDESTESSHQRLIDYTIVQGKSS